MEAGLSSVGFFIRKMDERDSAGTSDIPVTSLPLMAFMYLSDGEVLCDVNGVPYLCGAGHLLLIPEETPFAIRHYHSAHGYTGVISASMLPESLPLPLYDGPVQKAFWFDEGAFVRELFNMLYLSYGRRDWNFIEKGLGLLFQRMDSGRQASMPEAVSHFLEMVFDPAAIPSDISFYASSLGISTNYLSRLVKNATGRSVGAWVDSSRLSRAKRLLKDTDMQIIDVAASVGLEDQSYFSRFFRRHAGLTPREFRKLMQG